MKAKKNPKADLNQYKLIFFQVGLIISLGITYFGIEWSFDGNSDYTNEKIKVDMILDETPPVTELKVEVIPPPPPPAPEIIEVVEDELEIEESVIESTETDLEDAIQVIQVDAVEEAKMEETIEDVPFVIIENVPVYPGCENEKNNLAKKECMSAKIQEIVKANFDTGLGAELGLEGVNRVFVVFKINHKGFVEGIKARGPHKILEEEAERVIRLIPKMTPGFQRNRPVNVTYALPIIFDVKPRS